MAPIESAPAHILILGSGVFGLSTAFALTKRSLFASSKITVLDRSTFPAADGSSIDTSRIIRPDYKEPAYATLAALAQDEWRKQGPNELGGEGRYTENGLMLVANKGVQGEEYVAKSMENARRLAKPGDEESVVWLENKEAIEATVKTGGGSGDWGYINKRSGWADAEASMRFLHQQVVATNRISFVKGTAESLLFSDVDGATEKKVTGVVLADKTTLTADLVILAMGAWTGKLIDLRGRAQATGQVLCYVDITDEEQARLNDIPTLLNMSEGMFIIPPRHNLLKVARHGYGYSNPISLSPPESAASTAEPESRDGSVICSVPHTKHDDPNLCCPLEGETACRRALAEMIPSLADRPFSRSKICWYTDTPTADFIITYHPSYSQNSLFLATGGSGHGFKFLPVIGDKIVDVIEGRCPEDFVGKWGWNEEPVKNVVTEDGSRGGRTGMILCEELAKVEEK